MEWVETTAKTIEAAREIALDRLGVHADEAEIEIVEEPKSGLFGLMRGEARVRARIKPTQVRPKPDRRRQLTTMADPAKSIDTTRLFRQKRHRPD